MAKLHDTRTFHLQVNVVELRLILKALGGRLKEGEVVEAAVLGDELTKQRALDGQQDAIENKKLMTSLLDAGVLQVGCQYFEYTPPKERAQKGEQ